VCAVVSPPFVVWLSADRRVDGQEWYGAVILKWANDRALIHYIGWQTMWNEWFSHEDMLKRTRPLTATPRFGILSTKDERNRIKRCMNRADELWGEPDGADSNHDGAENENGESELGSVGRARDLQGAKAGDSEAGSNEGGSPTEGDSDTAEGSSRDQQERDNPSEDNPAAEPQALLDFLESIYAQQARIDTAREIEESAAVARDTEETPLRGDAVPAQRDMDESSDESDEDSGVSESESDEDSQPAASGRELTGALADGLNRADLAASGQDLAETAGAARDGTTSAGVDQGLAATDQHSFLHSSRHAFNGAISALDKKLTALGIELYPAGWGKDKDLDRESVRAQRVVAANRKAVQRFRPADLALLFNRALCHHYSRHYFEAEADFDLVLHRSTGDIE
jgi:hypothetical protein